MLRVIKYASLISLWLLVGMVVMAYISPNTLQQILKNITIFNQSTAKDHDNNQVLRLFRQEAEEVIIERLKYNGCGIIEGGWNVYKESGNLTFGTFKVILTFSCYTNDIFFSSRQTCRWRVQTRGSNIARIKEYDVIAGSLYAYGDKPIGIYGDKSEGRLNEKSSELDYSLFEEFKKLEQENPQLYKKFSDFILIDHNRASTFLDLSNDDLAILNQQYPHLYNVYKELKSSLTE